MKQFNEIKEIKEIIRTAESGKIKGYPNNSIWNKIKKMSDTEIISTLRVLQNQIGGGKIQRTDSWDNQFSVEDWEDSLYSELGWRNLDLNMR